MMICAERVQQTIIAVRSAILGCERKPWRDFARQKNNKEERSQIRGMFMERRKSARTTSLIAQVFVDEICVEKHLPLLIELPVLRFLL